MKTIAVTILACLFTGPYTSAQTGIDSLTESVRLNNLSIQANQKYWEARSLEFQTGLTLYDPFIEYDYMFGTPALAGNQRDFSVTQRLDFPTAYGRKKELSRLQSLQTEDQHRVFTQNILLRAKLIALDLVYVNKKAEELDRRLRNTRKLVQDYQKKVDLGDAIILDLNKARVQLLNLETEADLNKNERRLLLTQLTDLNGGIPVIVNQTTYPLAPVVPDFQILDSLIEANDPELQVYEQEQEVLRQQVSVQKALDFPKIEAGYHSQGILGQSYKGFHAGITIPLWENRNRLKTTEANLNYSISSTAARRLEHRLENRRLYEQLDTRKKSMDEYNRLLPSLNNTQLLNKALHFGQITVIQYFQEESFYFASYDRYLQLEREYHKALAQLYRFLL